MKRNEEIYREQILELYKNPLNFGHLKSFTHKFSSLNPLCGDEMEIELFVEGDLIKDIGFLGKGCAISISSASLLTEKLKGMKINDVLKMNSEDVLKIIEAPLGPSRLKCALLPLEAVKSSLKNAENK